MFKIAQILQILYDYLLKPIWYFFKLGKQKPRIRDIIFKTKGARKCRKIEQLLKDYPNDLVSSFEWDTGEETDCAEAILEDSSSVHEGDDEQNDLSKQLAKSMRKIRGYQTLCRDVEERRAIIYNSQNEEHEKILLRLWNLLNSQPIEARISLQWQKIGFQGDDPATDFRGMGLLGLEQLVFFAQYDVENCLKVYSLSHHPKIGFPFAIAGITITAICYELLISGKLKNHFYNSVEQPPLEFKHFNQVYCRIFSLWSDFWLWTLPDSVMEFNDVKRRFVCALEAYLLKEDANLCSASIDDILSDLHT